MKNLHTTGTNSAPHAIMEYDVVGAVVDDDVIVEWRVG